MTIEYVDFEIEIRRADSEEQAPYEARVVSQPSGQRVRSPFTPPWSGMQLDQLFADLEQLARSDPRRDLTTAQQARTQFAPLVSNVRFVWGSAASAGWVPGVT